MERERVRVVARGLRRVDWKPVTLGAVGGGGGGVGAAHPKTGVDMLSLALENLEYDKEAEEVKALLKVITDKVGKEGGSIHEIIKTFEKVMDKGQIPRGEVLSSASSEEAAAAAAIETTPPPADAPAAPVSSSAPAPTTEPLPSTSRKEPTAATAIASVTSPPPADMPTVPPATPSAPAPTASEPLPSTSSNEPAAVIAPVTILPSADPPTELGSSSAAAAAPTPKPPSAESLPSTSRNEPPAAALAPVTVLPPPAAPGSSSAAAPTTMPPSPVTAEPLSSTSRNEPPAAAALLPATTAAPPAAPPAAPASSSAAAPTPMPPSAAPAEPLPSTSRNVSLIDKLEPSKTIPPKVVPSKAVPPKMEPSKAVPPKMEPSKAMLPKVVPQKAEPSKPLPPKAMPPKPLIPTLLKKDDKNRKVKVDYVQFTLTPSRSVAVVTPMDFGPEMEHFLYIQLNKMYTFRVTNVVSPGEFYLAYVSERPPQREFEVSAAPAHHGNVAPTTWTDMQFFYKLDGIRMEYKLRSDPHGKRMYACREGEGDTVEYNRVTLITKDMYLDRADVLFVDSGLRKQIDFDQLYELPVFFTEPPARAFKCSLANILPKDSNTWSASICTGFQNMTLGQRLTAVIHTKSVEKWPDLSISYCKASITAYLLDDPATLQEKIISYGWAIAKPKLTPAN